MNLHPHAQIHHFQYLGINIFAGRGASRNNFSLRNCPQYGHLFNVFCLKKKPFSITVQILIIKKEVENFHFKTFLAPLLWKPQSLEKEFSIGKKALKKGHQQGFSNKKVAFPWGRLCCMGIFPLDFPCGKKVPIKKKATIVFRTKKWHVREGTMMYWFLFWNTLISSEKRQIRILFLNKTLDCLRCFVTHQVQKQFKYFLWPISFVIFKPIQFFPKIAKHLEKQCFKRKQEFVFLLYLALKRNKKWKKKKDEKKDKQSGRLFCTQNTVNCKITRKKQFFFFFFVFWFSTF